MIRTFKFLTFCIMAFRIPFGIAQDVDNTNNEKLAVEHIYLHIDKSYYTAGEDIWFKAYVRDAKNHGPSNTSEVLYVELMDPEHTILHQRTMKVNTGSVAGDFKLSPKLQSGIYAIRAYTAYMRNFGNTGFFEKTIFVNGSDSILSKNSTEKTPLANKTFDTQFFPEGGYLVNGFLNPVAFKALDNHGNGIPVSGKLIDDTGNLIQEFTDMHLGMGLFHFIPKENRNYHVLISYAKEEKRFELPTALNSGVLMTVSNQPMHYKVELRGTPDLKMKDYRLLGKQNKGAVLNLTVNANKREHTTIIKIAKDLLEEGVLELTLFNQDKQPIAERLLFHENSVNDATLNLTTHKTTYGKGKLVKMELAIDEWKPETSMADLSLSVTHTAVNPSAINTIDIRTYLLLTSVLKGEIEQPGYYFYSDNSDRQTHLDVLMRTQGWRQYVLDADVAAGTNYFLPEKGLSLSGKVVSSFNEKEPLIGTVKLTYDNTEEMVLDEVKTDANGKFVFKALSFSDTTNVLLSANVNYANKKRKPTLNYKVILDSVVPPKVNISQQKAKFTLFSQAREEAQRNSRTLLKLDNTIALDEAFIAAKKQPKALDKFALKRRGMPYKEPSHTLDFDGLDVPQDEPLISLQGRIPGLSIRGGKVYLRGNSSFTGDNSALILMNGIPIDDAGILMTGDIDFVDVLTGPRAAIYGSRAANGILAIFTKNGTESIRGNEEGIGAVNFKHLGYDYPRNFYRPSYPKKDSKSEKTDSSTTLFWQPFVKLNKDGKAQISFYTSDASGIYQASVEGITEKGQVVTSKVNFEVLTDVQFP